MPSWDAKASVTLERIPSNILKDIESGMVWLHSLKSYARVLARHPFMTLSGLCVWNDYDFNIAEFGSIWIIDYNFCQLQPATDTSMALQGRNLAVHGARGVEKWTLAMLNRDSGSWQQLARRPHRPRFANIGTEGSHEHWQYCDFLAIGLKINTVWYVQYMLIILA